MLTGNSEARILSVADAVEAMAELIGRHAGQMQAYRQVMERAFAGAEVECMLLSSTLRALGMLSNPVG